MLFGYKLLAAAAALVMTASVAQAGTTIVNLSASPTSPNAGRNSGTNTYNPINLSLTAGVYTVRLAGLAGGGLYDAYTVYAPTAANAAYTEAGFSVSLNDGTSAIYTQATVGGTTADYDGNFKAGRYNTAALAYAAYRTASPLYTFTLATAQTVAFYIDDPSYPYFGDDSAGISLAISAVPEPATLGLLGAGVAGLALMRRRRRSGPATA